MQEIKLIKLYCCTAAIKKVQLEPKVGIFYGNSMGVGGGAGRPETTAHLHGRLTAAA